MIVNTTFNKYDVCGSVLMLNRLVCEFDENEPNRM